MLCGMWTSLPSQHKRTQCLLSLQSTPEQPKPRTGIVMFLCPTHRISLKGTTARYLRPLQKVRHRGHRSLLTTVHSVMVSTVGNR